MTRMTVDFFATLRSIQITISLPYPHGEVDFGTVLLVGKHNDSTARLDQRFNVFIRAVQQPKRLPRFGNEDRAPPAR